MANRVVKTHAAKSALNDLGTGPVDSHGAPAITMYVTFGAGTSAGAVQLEGSPDPTFAGTWAAIGSPVAWGVASSVKYVAVNEAHRYVRARISTAVVGGTVDVHVVTGGFASGEYLEAG